MKQHIDDWATWTFIWDQAVQRQADRVLGAKFEDAHVEVMLFADALRNVLRGAERVLGTRHAAMVTFLEAVPDVRHVRDMFEHFDKYVEGVGHRAEGRVSGTRRLDPLAHQGWGRVLQRQDRAVPPGDRAGP